VDVTVALRNRASRATPALRVLLDDYGSRSATLGPVYPGQVALVRLRDPADFDAASISAYDASTGARYVLQGYFERSLGGRIDIVVDSIDTTRGLAGALRNRTGYFGNDEWGPFILAPTE
jgi:hypothetical protein